MAARVVWETKQYRAIEIGGRLVFERTDGEDALGITRWSGFKRADYELALHQFIRALIEKRAS